MDDPREHAPANDVASPDQNVDPPSPPPGGAAATPVAEAAIDPGAPPPPQSAFVGARADWDAIDQAAREESDRRLRPLSALGRIFGLYLSHIRLFAVLGIPGGVLAGVINLSGLQPRTDTGPWLLLLLATIAINGILGLAIIAAADDVRAGRIPTVRGVAGRAAKRTIPVLVSSVARYLLLAAAAGLVAVVAGVVVAGTGARSVPIVVVGVAAVAIGLVVVVAIRWCVADAAIVLEDAGPFEALGRSRALTRENTIRLVALYLVVAALVLPASIGSGLLGVVIGSPALSVAISIGVGIVTFPILSITAATILGDLTGRSVAASAIGPRPARRAGFALGWLVLGVVTLAISLPTFGAAAAQNTLDRVPAADRGHIYAGTIRNPADPCHPLATKTLFAGSETIYVGGYFTQIVPSGQTAIAEVSVNGLVLASVPLPSSAGTTGCYYEIDPLTGARSGRYRIAVKLGLTTIAEGSFEVR